MSFLVRIWIRLFKRSWMSLCRKKYWILFFPAFYRGLENNLVPELLHDISRNMQFVRNLTFGLWEKNGRSTLKNVFQKTNKHTCDYLYYVTLLNCLRWSIVWFRRAIRKCFLVWVLFAVKARFFNYGI